MRFWLIVAIGAVGCGKPTSMTKGSPSDLVDAEQRLEAAFCQYEARCGIIGASEEASCEASAKAGVTNLHVSSFSGWISYSTYEGEVASGRATVDLSVANACITQVANAACGTALTVAEQCLTAFKGTVADGGACSSSMDCVTGLCIPPNAQTCTGTCQMGVAAGSYCADFTDACAAGDYCSTNTQTCDAPAAAGAACEWQGSIATCVAGYYCDPFKKTCLVLGAAGAMCLSDDQCQAGLRCSAMAKCTAPVADGAACQYNEDCRVGSSCVGVSASAMGTCAAAAAQAGAPCPQTGCGAGLYCDAASVCRAQIDQGGSCTRADACKDGLACIGASSTQPGSCAPWLDAGQACSGAVNSGCPADMACTSGTCQPTGTVGSACSGGDCRPLLYCDSTTQKCTPMVGLGGMCTPPVGQSADSPCALGQCDATSNVCAPIPGKC